MNVRESLRFAGIPLRKSRELVTYGSAITIHRKGTSPEEDRLCYLGSKHLFISIFDSNSQIRKVLKRVSLPEKDYAYRVRTRFPGVYHLFQRVK